jgi:transposase
LPKSKKEQQELAEIVGTDGYHLLQAVYAAKEKPWLQNVPAVEILRCVWVQQFWDDNGRVRRRKVSDMPPVAAWIRSPFDIEACYCTKGQTGWIDYKVYLTETCDPDYPRLITQVETIAATVQDCQVTVFQIDWEARSATCPEGQPSIAWYPSHSPRGQPVIRVFVFVLTSPIFICG